MASQATRYDIGLAVAQAIVYHRYMERADRRLRETPGTGLIKAVCEHVIRIQRLSEGFAAFATTGVEDEIMFLTRPALELFASQAILQHGHVSHHDKRAMTIEEKVDKYYLHSEFTRSRFLKKHPNWPGFKYSAAERSKVIADIDIDLNASGFSFQADKAWHGFGTDVALKKAAQIVSCHLSSNALEEFHTSIPMLIEFMNFGIHGSPFGASPVRTRNEHGEAELTDHRTVQESPYWHIVTILANLSLQLFAGIYTEGNLIAPMLSSALDDVKLHGFNFVQEFPTRDKLALVCKIDRE